MSVQWKGSPGHAGFQDRQYCNYQLVGLFYTYRHNLSTHGLVILQIASDVIGDLVQLTVGERHNWIEFQGAIFRRLWRLLLQEPM